VVRKILIGATLAAALPASADPAPQGLQIRLTVVKSCTSDAGTCPPPHQRGDASKLPAQLRDLAPSHATEGEEAAPAPLTYIY